jgi:hypothetical protein
MNGCAMDHPVHRGAGVKSDPRDSKKVPRHVERLSMWTDIIPTGDQNGDNAQGKPERPLNQEVSDYEGNSKDDCHLTLGREVPCFGDPDSEEKREQTHREGQRPVQQSLQWSRGVIGALLTSQASESQNERVLDHRLENVRSEQ